jgi:hypothetical protein
MNARVSAKQIQTVKRSSPRCPILGVHCSPPRPGDMATSMTQWSLVFVVTADLKISIISIFKGILSIICINFFLSPKIILFDVIFFENMNKGYASTLK